jgi:hypothetical protein
MATQIGAGPAMFLIGMKQLMIFFALMTFINIPIYVFLWGKASVVKLDINSFFAQISLGSLELDMQSCS